MEDGSVVGGRRALGDSGVGLGAAVGLGKSLGRGVDGEEAWSCGFKDCCKATWFCSWRRARATASLYVVGLARRNWHFR